MAEGRDGPTGSVFVGILSKLLFRNDDGLGWVFSGSVSVLLEQVGLCY